MKQNTIYRGSSNNAFGLFDYTMIGKLRRLLKPHGLWLRVISSRHWGDLVEVYIVPLSEKPTRKKKA